MTYSSLPLNGFTNPQHLETGRGIRTSTTDSLQQSSGEHSPHAGFYLPTALSQEGGSVNFFPSSGAIGGNTSFRVDRVASAALQRGSLAGTPIASESPLAVNLHFEAGSEYGNGQMEAGGAPSVSEPQPAVSLDSDSSYSDLGDGLEGQRGSEVAGDQDYPDINRFCTYCSSEDYEEISLGRHFKACHSDVPKNKWYRCPTNLRKTFVDKRGLQRHVNSCHTPNGGYVVCEGCGNTFTRLDRAMTHFFQIHPTPEMEAWQHSKQKKVSHFFNVEQGQDKNITFLSAAGGNPD
ncbi:MAG: hypothetical protein S4CHLAM81_09710 [Chlamydiales bacterium]|nr:hypothetical protein [Chlamydiales bacterium]MCH9635749.1 hypothetical protein [Chlamydiales bacterium]MCH9704112.1 hypothetical protein [Chlamydiota bacterium]